MIPVFEPPVHPEARAPTPTGQVPPDLVAVCVQPLRPVPVPAHPLAQPTVVVPDPTQNDVLPQMVEPVAQQFTELEGVVLPLCPRPSSPCCPGGPGP